MSEESGIIYATPHTKQSSLLVDMPIEKQVILVSVIRQSLLGLRTATLETV